MKVVVNDANILIDLVKLQLLPHFFGLGWEYHTTSLVFDELFEDQQEAFSAYQDKGVFFIAELDATELGTIIELQLEKPQLSEQDCSALFYTIKKAGVLLSSDKNLREFAENKSVEVHGHLWIFDAMVAQNCISPSRAADKLEELINTINPKLRLPDHECKRRLGLWRKCDRVNAIADKIAGLSSLNEFCDASSCFGTVANQSMLNILEKDWLKNPGISPLELAAALRGASQTASYLGSRESVEMVWTGPFTGLVASRHTEQVLLQVIGSANNRLFMVSFVAYDIDSINKALQDAVNKNVKINILLESSKAHGGKIDIDSISAFKKAIPTANVYEWNLASKSSDNGIGAVHAKCAVADGSTAFITSANLTRAAMENNMELGVLINGGNLPEKLDRHLEALVTIGAIRKI
jgi:cardiolipin synthase